MIGKHCAAPEVERAPFYLSVQIPEEEKVASKEIDAQI